MMRRESRRNDAFLKRLEYPGKRKALSGVGKVLLWVGVLCEIVCGTRANNLRLYISRLPIQFAQYFRNNCFLRNYKEYRRSPN